MDIWYQIHVHMGLELQAQETCQQKQNRIKHKLKTETNRTYNVIYFLTFQIIVTVGPKLECTEFGCFDDRVVTKIKSLVYCINKLIYKRMCISHGRTASLELYPLVSAIIKDLFQVATEILPGLHTFLCNFHLLIYLV